MTTPSIVLVTLAGTFNVTVGVWGQFTYRRARRRADASWEEAKRLAEYANLQARVLVECGDLLCDDCRQIVHGHYMRHAFERIRASMDESGV